jgi:beta-lactamase class A
MNREPEYNKKIKNKYISCVAVVVFIFILIGTNIATYLSFVKISDDYRNFLGQKEKFPFLDPARVHMPQEHFFTTVQPLREELKMIAGDSVFPVSLYFEFLNTGGNISINPDFNLWPASLAKLPLAIVAMKKIQNGEWRLDDEFLVFDSDKDSESGEFYHTPSGETVAVEKLFYELLVNSDNTAYKIFLRNLSTEEISEFVLSSGLGELFSEDGRVSAKEYSRILKILYSSSYLDVEYSQKILGFLVQAGNHGYFQKGLPENFILAHKYGENSVYGVCSDAGIFYVPDRPFLLVVMVGGLKNADDKQKAEMIMAEIAKKSYEFVTSR